MLSCFFFVVHVCVCVFFFRRLSRPRYSISTMSLAISRILCPRPRTFVGISRILCPRPRTFVGFGLVIPSYNALPAPNSGAALWCPFSYFRAPYFCVRHGSFTNFWNNWSYYHTTPAPVLEFGCRVVFVLFLNCILTRFLARHVRVPEPLFFGHSYLFHVPFIRRLPVRED